MGYNQQKGGNYGDVCSTIKHIEEGSNNMASGSSPIRDGGNEPSSHPGFKHAPFKKGQSPNSVVRRKD